jgi:hypothetical protein
MSLFEFEFRKRSSKIAVREDELTSRVFGILDAVGKDILSEWLQLEGIDTIKYWPRFSGLEPDVIVYCHNKKNIVIECKLDDLGSVEQLKKEYKFAKKINADLLFLTATISKPEIIDIAENELKLKNEHIRWETWESLYKVVKNFIGDGKVSNEGKYLLIQLEKYLRWMKLGYSFAEIMKQYKKAYDEGWLEIISDKFDRFMKEIHAEFNATTDSIKKYQGIKARGISANILNDKSWINIFSNKLENINEKLYYYVIFDSNEYCWEIRLAGDTKKEKQIIKDYFDEIEDFKYITVDQVSGLQKIAYNVIVDNPDFSNPNKLKKEIINNSLEFISYIDTLMAKMKKT